MVVSGGVGVVAVVAFVSALAFGARVAEVPAGARLGVTGAGGPLGAALLTPRCQGERVMTVALRSAEGTTRWRLTSAKGAIDERYVIGAEETPFATETEVVFYAPLTDGELTAEVAWRGDPDDTDELRFDPSLVPDSSDVLYQGSVIPAGEFEAQAAAAADCGASSRNLGAVTWLFILAALGVVVTYLMMLTRYLQGRTGRG